MTKKSSKKRGTPVHPGLAFFLTTLAGVGVFMSFPNFVGVEFFFLQWIALVPVLWAVEGRGNRGTFLWAWWAGFVTNLGGFYWITHLVMDFGHMPFSIAGPICAVNAAYQGLVFAFWALSTRFFHQRCRIPVVLAAPVCFALVESLIPMVFPWYFANGQYAFYPVIQMLEWTGIAGLTWLLVFVNCAVWSVVRARLHGEKIPRLVPVLALGLLLLAVGYGQIRIGEVDAAMEDAPKVRVGMVEANIGIWEKEGKGLMGAAATNALAFNLVKHQRLSAELEKEGVDLIVWPESSYIPPRAAWVKSTPIEAVAVGERGSIYLRSDEGWRDPGATLPEGVLGTGIRDVWADGGTSIYAVGDGGLVLRFDGERWEKIQGAGDTDYQGVTGFIGRSGDPTVWVVGEGGNALLLSKESGKKLGKIGIDKTLYDISSTSKGLLSVAVGEKGTIIEVNPAGWDAISGPAKKDLLGVWVYEDQRAWAVGEEGLFERTRGGKWSSVAGSPDGLRAVWGSAPDDVYAGGRAGVILRFDGKSWKTERTGGTAAVTAIGGGASTPPVAVLEDGSLLERREQGWVRVEVPGNAPLRGVAGLGFRSEFWLPYNVSAFYQSSAPLPLGTTAAEVGMQEAVLANHDRMAPQRGFRTPVIFGIVLFDSSYDPPRPYNATLLLDEEGRVKGHYDKNHLLVFGEYIPFGDVFPQLYEWVPAANHFYPGREVEGLAFEDYNLGALVCYEDILPSFTRRVAARGVDALFNVTNDAWFGKTAEPYLHLALATFRTVENRKYMVRSTNTGVSAFIDANGRITKATSLDGEETLVSDVPMLREETFYTRYGDVFLAGCYGALALFFVYGFWPGATGARPTTRKRKKKK